MFENQDELAGQVAIVTGAGAGLGRTHALELARRGASVLVNDLDEEAAKKVALEITDANGSALSFATSVTDEQGVADMVDFVVQSYGQIDILVNNAGILRDRSFAKLNLDDFRFVMDVHFMGSVVCTKAVWDIMRSRNYGRIVLTTSCSGLFGNFGQTNYAAAKMALVGFMQSLSIEGDKYGIQINCLAPTASTQMMEGILEPEVLDQLAPEFASHGLVALVGKNAPSRKILCAGGGHFSIANIMLTAGARSADPENGADWNPEFWEQVSDTSSFSIPEYGFRQVEQELAGR
ncbi:SDR family NAD(P)-dependent oxidoreductase [uncultured Tateyamaria sp.]|uniref:SDR family NAD(P)-dependent oxidoreductase n=1 Tax=uncultured Tateyamaria sp. TaxID=455651 RepID=UPI002628EDD1|nr:SDR family NAD(P)-dependent oxidoreductase [uncultured Tateyamaria sp.]